MERKGQAAMEFLMTYGWAILAAVIAIGVLAYFGVFSPGKYISNACTINAPFGCDEYSLKVGAIDLTIRNGGGESYTISNVSVTGCTTPDTAIAPIADGAKSEIVEISGCADMTAGAKVKKDITITYTKTVGGTLAQTITGTISGRVPA